MQIDDMSEMIDKKLHEMEKKVMNKIDSFETKVIEVEKNTLWKIKDCEELLKIRVNQEYVNDNIKKSEEKMQAYVKKIFRVIELLKKCLVDKNERRKQQLF